MEILSGFGIGVVIGYFVGLLAFDIVQFLKNRHERFNN